MGQEPQDPDDPTTAVNGHLFHKSVTPNMYSGSKDSILLPSLPVPMTNAYT